LFPENSEAGIALKESAAQARAAAEQARKALEMVTQEANKEGASLVQDLQGYSDTLLNEGDI
jgi:hypothetical protein